MNNHQILTVFSKIYLSVLFAEGQMYLVKDFMKKEVKQRLNHSLGSVKATCKIFERGLDDKSIAFAEDDIELVDLFYNLAILCEQKGKINELNNDLNELIEKYKKVL
jgi:hypothetical protein